MLVIISDLHLTDGTSGTTISAGAFRLLAERLSDLALSASYRRDGHYEPISQIDLVLLGDVLDVIRSTQWLDRPARPWDDPKSPQLFERVTKITGDILRKNADSLGVFRQLAEEGVRVPCSLANGRPTAGESLLVPVRIHYMVGNHDWPFHLSGQNGLVERLLKNQRRTGVRTLLISWKELKHGRQSEKKLQDYELEKI